MAREETELEMCQRHVREGEAHVLRQRQILASLRANHHPTALAEQLLVEFERTLVDHQTHLARVISA